MLAAVRCVLLVVCGLGKTFVVRCMLIVALSSAVCCLLFVDWCMMFAVS